MFDYQRAFACNNGLLDRREQTCLREARIAIAGMGAVGGEYLMALTRCGVGRFNIADFDCFELKNFNRQYGATMSNLGRHKAEAMADAARDVNPELKISTFGSGISSANIESFLEGCQVAIDGIDIFEADAHREFITACQRKGIPVLAALPAGFGAGLLVFTPGSMGFNEYFDFRSNMSAEEKVMNLVMGFAPAGFHVRYMDLGSVSFRERRGPSSIAAVKLCAGLVATQTMVALLHPAELQGVPWYTHVDARLLRVRHRRLWLGNRNPVQRFKKWVAGRIMAKRTAERTEGMPWTANDPAVTR